MYRITVTANDYPTGQRVHLSVWEVDETGKRTQVLHEVNIVPYLAGGLFDNGWESSLQSAIRWLYTTRPELRDTDE